MSSDKVYYFGEDQPYYSGKVDDSLIFNEGPSKRVIFPCFARLKAFNQKWDSKNIFFTEEEFNLYLKDSNFSESLKKRMASLTPNHIIRIMKVSLNTCYYLACIKSDSSIFKEINNVKEMKVQMAEIRAQIVEQTKSLQQDLNSLTNKVNKMLKEKPFIKNFI